MKILNYLTRNQKLGTLKGTFIAEKASYLKGLSQKYLSSICQGRVLFRNSYEGCEIQRLLPRWIPTEKGTMVSRVADEWDEKEESRGKGRKEGRALERNERGQDGEKRRERKTEGGERKGKR